MKLQAIDENNEEEMAITAKGEGSLGDRDRYRNSGREEIWWPVSM